MLSSLCFLLTLSAFLLLLLLCCRDNHQRVCFALALWNGKDPYLKERMFGTTGHQGS